jgi:hypothetical protein
MLACTLKRTHNGRLLSLMRTWTHVYTHTLFHERLHAGTNAQTKACPQGNRWVGESGPRQRGTYSVACEHMRSSVREDKHLFRGICAALTGHLPRSVFGLRIDHWEPVQKFKARCAATSKNLCCIDCTLVQSHQSPCAGSSHIHSSFTTPVQQFRAPAEQRR